MLKPRGDWIRTSALAAISGLIFGGTVLLPPPANLMGQGPGKPKSADVATHKSNLTGDIAIAIQLVEKDEFRTFLELYCPVELLRKLRQEDLVDRAAAVMASQPKTKVQLLILLKALMEQSPKFDKSGGMATLDVDPTAGGIEEVPGELKIPDAFNLTATGLGSDLNRVIADAIKLLETAEFGTFVDRVFPASELGRVQSSDARKGLLMTFQETPELAKTMIADLKQLQSVEPEMTENGTVATFSIPSSERSKRTIKFQKIGTNWRLFDDSPRVVTELSRQAKLKPGSTIKIIHMERVGGNWRFIELPILRMDAL